MLYLEPAFFTIIKLFCQNVTIITTLPVSRICDGIHSLIMLSYWNTQNQLKANGILNLRCKGETLPLCWAVQGSTTMYNANLAQPEWEVQEW